MCGQTQNALQLTNNSCCRRASRRNAPFYSPRPACPFPCGRWRRCPWACHCCWWRMIFRYRRFASYSSEGRQERWKTQRPRRRRPSATRAGQRAPCRAIGPRRGAAGGGPWLRWSVGSSINNVVFSSAVACCCDMMRVTVAPFIFQDQTGRAHSTVLVGDSNHTQS